MSDVFFFGRLDTPGHILYGRDRRTMRYEASPWGMSLDTGLLYDHEKHKYGPPDSQPNGEFVTAHKGGWTAVSFWDRSGDGRGNSNSAFLVDQEMTGEEVLSLAREQWPEVFNRPGFPIKSPTHPPAAPCA